MRTNVKAKAVSHRYGATHEGAPAARMTDEQALRRSVLSCLLGEREFYEDGVEISQRIMTLAANVPATTLAALAVETRHEANLRHAPLLLLTALAKHGGPIVGETIDKVIARADELAELIAVYSAHNPAPADGKRRAGPTQTRYSAQLKRGLAAAAMRFNEYRFAKYDREGEIKLRDVLRIAHWRETAKQRLRDDEPAHLARQALYDRVYARTLATPDTWETELSAGADKRATFERLIREDKLGYLALLRNLRGMIEAGCDVKLIDQAIVARKGGAERVLPFRYIAAARAAPQLEPAIDTALCEAIATSPALKGRTGVLVDVSDSMNAKLSAKSDLTRMDAAAALASVIHGDLRVFTFSDHVVEVPPRRGMAGVDAIIRSQTHSGTYLGQAVAAMNAHAFDRLIVLTDEQSHDRVNEPKAKRAYMVNVASARHGVGYGRWNHVDGFSESVLRWIIELEAFEDGSREAA